MITAYLSPHGKEKIIAAIGNGVAWVGAIFANSMDEAQAIAGIFAGFAAGIASLVTAIYFLIKIKRKQ